MKMLKSMPLILLTIYFFTACAPIPVVTMTPLVETTRFDWGNEIVSLKNENIQMEVAYIRSTDAHLFFNIEVRNATGDTLLVNPKTYSYLPLAADTNSMVSVQVFAIDPEKRLLEINKSEARENADSRESYLLELTSMMTNTASDVSNMGKFRTEEEIEQEEAGRQQRRNNYEVETYNRELTFLSLNEQRDFWTNQMFRKTHIPHGYSLKGTIAFPRTNKASFLKFNFMIDDKDFIVVYKQNMISSNSYSQ